MPALQGEDVWAEERPLGDLQQSPKRPHPFTHYTVILVNLDLWVSGQNKTVCRKQHAKHLPNSGFICHQFDAPESRCMLSTSPLLSSDGQNRKGLGHKGPARKVPDFDGDSRFIFFLGCFRGIFGLFPGYFRGFSGCFRQPRDKSVELGGISGVLSVAVPFQASRSCYCPMGKVVNPLTAGVLPSTIASHSAIPHGTSVAQMNANRKIRIAATTNAGSMRTNFCVLG